MIPLSCQRLRSTHWLLQLRMGSVKGVQMAGVARSCRLCVYSASVLFDLWLASFHDDIIQLLGALGPAFVANIFTLHHRC